MQHAAVGHASRLLQARVVQVRGDSLFGRCHLVANHHHTIAMSLHRLEVLAALTPKAFWRGDWRPGPRNIRFRYHVRERCDSFA